MFVIKDTLLPVFQEHNINIIKNTLTSNAGYLSFIMIKIRKPKLNLNNTNFKPKQNVKNRLDNQSCCYLMENIAICG